MRTITTLVVLALAGCGGETATDPQPTPPEEPAAPPAPPPQPPEPIGPAEVVISDAYIDDAGNAVTVLMNDGGNGEYYLDFFGALAGKPYGCPAPGPCPCPNDALGESERVNVSDAYAETVTWETASAGTPYLILAYSRGADMAAWTKTSSFDLC